MTYQIKEFQIVGLHGNKTFSIPIHQNKLVLVGENGTGKTTVANIICACLTQSWDKLEKYDFDYISFNVDHYYVRIPKEMAQFGSQSRLFDEIEERLLRKVPSRVLSQLRMSIYREPETKYTSISYEVERIARNYDVPTALIAKYVEEFSVQISNNTPRTGPKAPKLRKFPKVLDEVNVLYLPTYRRIESELETILSRKNPFEMQKRDPREARVNYDSHFLELVEFGMDDVYLLIQRKIQLLKDEWRKELNNLTGTYFQQVIRRGYGRVQTQKLRNLDAKEISDLFSRIGENILSEDDRKALRDLLHKIDRKGRLDEKDKVVAHFLTKLLEIYRRQKNSVKAIEEFFEVCNQYLLGKKLVYESSKFEFCISLTHNDEEDASTQIRPETLNLMQLSSGEKQIVSLFAHLYLSDSSGYFVIIDEPELSLSVEWQRRFLPDILNCGKCFGLIAVTHSPFVFDNELDEFAHSLSEYLVLDK
ncbi:MAG: AAA family ATPase [Pleurocapsa minor GSE-CHR-MK-17-07R]|jgi:predicted ATP-dependent endonuclease of OLD family|nr:AAA family ATPase [Pleurocapsa minor GSE-CHR-MK 17-07R]